ncbi:carboxymuconolactone decarboxylase [Bordetella trematum]|nr:carboxymuconolactone decarboxylase [Bordetella trematum]
MLDWDKYREELKTRIGELGQLSPQTLRGYQGWRALAPRPATWMPRPAN